ncbi:unnamed protein product [Closterium sp. NIES-64]|nr:unnamed protein product [Closterium sp. NIES-64]CAI5996052.1 unnamed protein product [Closterium sp. NIES-64]
MIASTSSSSSYESTRHQNGVTDSTFETSENSSANSSAPSWKENGITDRIVCFLEGLGSPSGCRHEDFRLQNGQEAFRGLHSDWVTNELLACARPTDAMIEEGLADRFAERGIRLIVNLEEAGEHPWCGSGITASGFSYTPDKFIKAGVGYLHAPWKDMACPPFPTMLSIVQSISLAIGRRHKVVVHCHAGLGRTGLVIACYLVAANSLAAADAVAVVRAMRHLYVEMPPLGHKNKPHCWLGNTPLRGGGGGAGRKGGGGGVGGVEEVTVFLFGAAFDVYCKQEMGAVVAILGAEANPPKGEMGAVVAVLGAEANPPKGEQKPILQGVSESRDLQRVSTRLGGVGEVPVPPRVTFFLASQKILEYCDRHIAAAYQKMKPTRLELDGGNLSTAFLYRNNVWRSWQVLLGNGTCSSGSSSRRGARPVAALDQDALRSILREKENLTSRPVNLSTAFLYRNNVRRSRQVLLGNGTCGSGGSSRRGARPVAALDQDALRSILREKENLTSRPVSQGKRFLAAASGDEEQAPYVPPLKRAKGVETFELTQKASGGEEQALYVPPLKRAKAGEKGNIGGETLGSGSGVTGSKYSEGGGLLQKGSVRGGVKEGVALQDEVGGGDDGGGVKDQVDVYGEVNGGKVASGASVIQGKRPNWMLREQRFQPMEKMVELVDVGDDDNEDENMGAENEAFILD